MSTSLCLPKIMQDKSTICYEKSPNEINNKNVVRTSARVTVAQELGMGVVNDLNILVTLFICFGAKKIFL